LDQVFAEVSGPLPSFASWCMSARSRAPLLRFDINPPPQSEEGGGVLATCPSTGSRSVEGVWRLRSVDADACDAARQRAVAQLAWCG
jgi:hypothetical protein